MMCRPTLLLLPLLAAVVLGQEPGESAEDKKLDVRIEMLIERLGSVSFSEREKATEALLEIGSSARAALQRAAQSDDAEIAGRAEELLARLPKPTHTLLDAIGNPLPQAKVSIHLIKNAAGGKDKIEIGPVPWTSDRDGGVFVPNPPAGGGFQGVAIVEHESYGRARIPFHLPVEPKVIQAPAGGQRH